MTGLLFQFNKLAIADSSAVGISDHSDSLGKDFRAATCYESSHWHG
jgi:hypothetical protein